MFAHLIDGHINAIKNILNYFYKKKLVKIGCGEQVIVMIWQSHGSEKIKSTALNIALCSFS